MEKSITTITGPSWAGVCYFSTCIQGGYSQGDWQGLNLGEHCGDNPVHVAQNRALLSQLLPSEPHWLQQVHGTQLYHATEPIKQVLDWHEAPQADASWTSSSHTVLAILTADCLPIVIADKKGQIIGVAHAGWRGLSSGVVQKLFLQLQQQLPDKAQWQAWIGPAISQSYFEVGAEVYDAFLQLDPALNKYFKFKLNTKKYNADLANIARHLLLKINPLMQVHLSQACTFFEKDSYYSYRRQNNTGRIATVAWLKAKE